MGNKDSGKLKCEMIKLDGTMTNQDGSITKSNFFDFLELPIGTPVEMQLTPEQAMKFRNHVVRLKIGTTAAIPLLCSGPQCPSAHICPFSEDKIWPISSICPVETQLLLAWTKTYITELGVDPDSATQMILVNKLVELDIIDYRANVGLSGARDSEAGTLLKTTVVDTGQSISSSLGVHPILEVKEKVHRMRQQILEALAVTPKEKYKRAAALRKTEDNADAANYMAKMRAAFAKMNEEQEKLHVASEIKEENDTIEDADWESIVED